MHRLGILFGALKWQVLSAYKKNLKCESYTFPISKVNIVIKFKQRTCHFVFLTSHDLKPEKKQKKQFTDLFNLNLIYMLLMTSYDLDMDHLIVIIINDQISQ